MLVHIALILMTLTPVPPAGSVSTDCTRFLVGAWVGKGVVRGFGTPVTVDNAYTYRRDGSFATINRYLGKDKRWNEQRLTGIWTATPARSRGRCTLVLKSEDSGMSSSSTSEIQMIDKDTFRSLGFDMKRARPSPTR